MILTAESRAISRFLSHPQPTFARLAPDILESASPRGVIGGSLRSSPLLAHLHARLIFLAQALGKSAAISVTFHFKRHSGNLRARFAIDALRHERTMIDSSRNVSVP